MGIDMLVLYFLIGGLVILLVGGLVDVIKDFIKKCQNVSVEEIVSTALSVILLLVVPTVVGYLVYSIVTYFIG